MSEFKVLDEETIWKLLEGHQNILQPLLEKEEEVFRRSRCPNCKSDSHDARVDPERPFIAGVPLPVRFLQCRNCQTEFDPYTNLTRRSPTGE